MTLVEVRRLRIELQHTGADIVDDVSFSIDAGEILGLVGESGSGKTTLGLAMMGHARKGAQIVDGEVIIDGTSVLDLSREQLTQIRGKLVAYVPQDPTAALNPSLRIGKQLSEMLEIHARELTPDERRARLQAVLADVKLPSAPDFLQRYPHQLSGGQQQRVGLACAFILHPKLIVLDEPTTGLDVSTQGHILDTIVELCRSRGVAALYITHDLAVVANMAQRVLVAYAGRVVEAGTRNDVFARPAHPYTRHLLRAIPVLSERRALTPITGQAPPPGNRPAGCFFAPRCSMSLKQCTVDQPPAVQVASGHTVRCIRAHEVAGEPMSTTVVAAERTQHAERSILAVHDLDAHYGSQQVAFGVSLELRPRECLALVGESGSGKTTVARAIIGLHTNRSGEITYRGIPLAAKARDRDAVVRQELQYIFQNPYNSLNPRCTIGETIASPLRQLFAVTGTAARDRIIQALASVSLPARVATCYPDQLSGGERQRVALARALVCEPKVMICDEITSALDVSIQASIVTLLQKLQEEYELAMLFITHNLALTRSIADRVIVMNEGRVVETGASDDVLDNPIQPYTRTLVERTPTLPDARESLA